MSTLPNQANIPPSWKQEVNQRIAAHKDRKMVLAAEPGAVSEVRHTASSRAAAAAARVAARYANVPSYSEILAADARAAVRATEAASKAALEAHAAAQSVLAGIEAASAAEPFWEASFAEDCDSRQTESEIEMGYSDSLPSRLESVYEAEGQGFEIRWEPGLPERQVDIAPVRATVGAEIPEIALEQWREPALPGQDGLGIESIAAVEPAQPIHANLIEFPREIVATRKVRPRLAEGPLGTPGGQLSIFEVDPASISTEPLMAGTGGGAVPAWAGPEWSGIELDAQPRPEFLGDSHEEALDAMLQRPERSTGNPGAVLLAPINRRLMAAVVNASLVTGAFLAVALAVASNLKSLPGVRALEVSAAIGLAVTAAIYHAVFYAFAKGTPGMIYAGISLCTFDERRPTRAQRFRRLGAMLLSVLPVGLGVMWAIFDEDHLSWHDRLSGTYLRKN